MSVNVNEIKNAAREFGCHDLVYLSENSSRELDYLDLLGNRNESGFKIDAVAEFQSRPVLYIVFGDHARNRQGDIVELQHLLANRGERAYLGFLRPGELEIMPINLDREKLKHVNPVKINSQSPDATAFFQSIASGSFSMPGTPESPDFVFDSIFKLMTQSSEELINTFGIPPLDVLSCIGRALFFRFLRDRKIILEKELQELISPIIKSWEDCFANADNSISVCNWLDNTFNGDLLPFSQDKETFFIQAQQSSDNGLFLHMQAILLGWEHVGNTSFQPSLDWNDLNFAHIPIGVLSQVYEQFSREWDEQQSKGTSVFYTPKSIARYLVEDAFASLPDKKNAKILDPSCGAGIFLVLAFRALVRSYWEQEKKRPDTRAIQDILYKQLCGFDISESALRLAALSLYITAIELNNSPRPPKSLKFPKPLQGTVLFNQRRPEENDTSGFILGSLRPDLSENFDHSFDLVIGNPPWSSINEGPRKNKIINAEFTKLTKKILLSRGLDKFATTYSNPDNDPDLPFLWRATEWARLGGLVAMALPARIFLKQTDSGKKAFETILCGIEITGILNGSNLSDTAVWPGMSQPFMLFFAKNNIPPAHHHFHFVSPQFEDRLNKKGLLRIDYNSASPISVKDAIGMPWLLKSLAIGTILDVEVLKKVFGSCKKTVKNIWQKENLYSGEGYNISASLKQSDAHHLLNLKDFQKPGLNNFCVNVLSLQKFCDVYKDRTTANMPRNERLYKAPLLIIPQSPGCSIYSPKSFILKEPVAFRKSYYGYSAHNHPEGILLVAFLHLLTHSVLFRYYVLMTSSRFGSERRTFLKNELETFPIPSLEKLMKKKEMCISLSKLLETEKTKPWDLINSFISESYGLEKHDLQIVNDSLEVGSPFQENRNKAYNSPSTDQQKAFYDHLLEMLSPSFEITGEKVEIRPIKSKSEIPCPWIFFSISSSNSKISLFSDDEKYLIDQALEEADKTGCSRVFVRSDGRLLVGLLAQYRYWTISRARLCGLHILRYYLDVFPVGRKS